jgi:hypothetical protein
MKSCEPSQSSESEKSPQPRKVSVTGLLGMVQRLVRLVLRTFGVMEAVLSVFYGALIGTVFSNYDKGWWWIIAGIAASAIYLPLLIIKVSSQWILPDQIFEHLDAKLELNNIKQELARKEAIDGFIDQAIKTLNSATCRISSEPDEALCQSAVADGLADVLSPLINRTQIVLDCNTSKFAVGALVAHNFQAGEELDYKNDWLIFRDDVGIKQDVSNDPCYLTSATGIALQFRQTLETVLNENRLVECAVKIHNQTFQLIGGPIPLVCDEKVSNGALWIVRECLQPPPHDLGNILLIFGRVVANWLSKYDECLWQQANKSKLERYDSEVDSAEAEETTREMELGIKPEEANETSGVVSLQHPTSPDSQVSA